ncbi:MAG: OmpA family protein [Rhodothalassiaceae bacterium]
MAQAVTAMPEARLIALGDGGVRVVLPGHIVFDSDGAAVRPRVRPALHQLATAISQTEAAVSVRGHTDALGSERLNQRMAQNRAEAIATVLRAHQVAADRLAVHGAGEADPAADNRTAAGRRANRRIEIDLIAPGRPQG